MNALKLAAASLLVLAMAAGVSAQDVKIYPGAKQFTPPSTEKATQAMPPGVTETIYFTDDPFSKVVAFYQNLGKVHTPPWLKKGAKLPSGQPVQETFYIFDGSTTLTFSKSWVKIQRPYVGAIDEEGAMQDYHDVRNVTAIFIVQKKAGNWPEK
ncbi:MAG: hypothetical protein WAL85_08015 [Candidatus Korobacteraceae bacterium]